MNSAETQNACAVYSCTVVNQTYRGRCGLVVTMHAREREDLGSIPVSIGMCSLVARETQQEHVTSVSQHAIVVPG